MPSFAWVSRFREGSWRAFRKFLLEERKDAASRFAVISAEKERIGEILVLYKKKPNSEEYTEERKGILIEPENSSLAKLMQAYCALGGNPFDISMFMSPATPLEGDQEEINNTFPGNGVVFMPAMDYAYDQGAKEGDVNILKYKTSRVGGKVTLEKESNTGTVISRSRAWITKEIRHKRTRIEEQILKLCDLREQLDQEVEDLIWATHGDMTGDKEFNVDRYNIDLTAARIVYRMDSTFRIPEDDFTVRYDKEAPAGEPGAPNLDALGGYPNLISDLPEEDNTA